MKTRFPATVKSVKMKFINKKSPSGAATPKGLNTRKGLSAMAQSCEHNPLIHEVLQDIKSIQITVKCQICEKEWIYWPDLDDLMQEKIEIWDTIDPNEN